MMTDSNTQTVTCSRARRVKVAALAGVGAALAGASPTFAAPPTADEVAGDALVDMGDRGVDFLTTYVLPTAVTLIGAGLAIGLFVKFGGKVKNWVKS